MRWTTALIVLLLLAAACGAEDGTSTAPIDPHAGHDHGMAMPPHPMSMPSTGVGSIAIQVVQGTKDGPRIGAGTVKVELFGPDKRATVVQAHLDQHGVTMLERLPLHRPLQPRVTVEHGGVPYQAVGQIMNRANPRQKITVTVYETTDKPANWDVQMWHVMVHPSENGLHVTEMLAVKNHGDRAFFAPVAKAGARGWVTLHLPPAAADIKMGGALQPKATTIADERLTWRGPFPPGLSQLRVGYRLPAPRGRATVTLTPPAAAKVLMVFVPHEFTQVQSDGLEAGEVYDVRGKPMRCYKATALSAGEQAALTISGLPRLIDAQAAASGSPFVPKLIAALGGGLALVLCMVVLLHKPAGEAAPRPA
ncbi:MAG: hypothetical protein ACYS5V_09995 [Planctomycetota bacterium]|jgi:hypothetical protein